MKAIMSSCVSGTGHSLYPFHCKFRNLGSPNFLTGHNGLYMAHSKIQNLFIMMVNRNTTIVSLKHMTSIGADS